MSSFKDRGFDDRVKVMGDWAEAKCAEWLDALYAGRKDRDVA